MKKYIKENKEIIIALIFKEERILKFNDNRKIYTNEKYDITVIEINKEKDKINDFMGIGDNWR